jgi:pyridoxal phosphate enzyme (YggS family)
MSISDNIHNIRADLPPQVKLIVVTKHRSLNEIHEALAAGATHIGENRVQEARDKFPQITELVEKHLIGHLQTNKAKYVVKLFDMVQSVDTLHLAEALNEEAAKINKVLPILVQVNVANDPNKHGFPVEDLFCPIKTIGEKYPHLKIKGLMTIVPHYENPQDARPDFKKIRELFQTLQLANFPGIDMEELSMGMSNDYRVAVEEGATMVRIGSAIFA